MSENKVSCGWKADQGQNRPRNGVGKKAVIGISFSPNALPVASTPQQALFHGTSRMVRGWMPPELN